MKLRIRWNDRDDLPERMYPVTDWEPDAYPDDLLMEAPLELYAVGTSRHVDAEEADADLAAEIERQIHLGRRQGTKQIIEPMGEAPPFADPAPHYRGTITWDLVAESPAEQQWLLENTDSPAVNPYTLKRRLMR